MRAWLAIALIAWAPTAAAGLSWSAPDAALEGHPVFARFEMTEGGQRVPHVDADLEIWLDGFRLMGSGDVHEHDGVFTVVTTPPAPGTLRFVAIMDGQTIEHFVEVSPAATGSMDARLVVDGRDISVVADAPNMALVTVHDGSDLSISHWNDGDAAGLEHALGNRGVQAIITTHPEDPVRRGALWIEAEGDGSTASTSVPGAPGHPECTDVVTDPDSAINGRLVWQAGTDVRVTQDGPATYRLLTVPLTTGALALPTNDFRALAADPFGQLTFRPGTVGNGWLVVDDGDVCQVPFTILPSPPGEGTLLVQQQPNPWGTRMDLAAVAAGAPLPHYEFDVRIFREGGDGSLFFAGKLHGHDGEASIHMTFLPPGNYTAEVFASPQGIETPVLANAPEGHVFTFRVPVATPADVMAGTHPSWMAPPAEPVPVADDRATPWPFGLGLLVLVWLAVRRADG